MRNVIIGFLMLSCAASAAFNLVQLKINDTQKEINSVQISLNAQNLRFKNAQLEFNAAVMQKLGVQDGK